MQTLIQRGGGNKGWSVLYASNAVNGVGVREVMNELKNQVRSHMYAHLRHTRACVRIHWVLRN